MFLPYELILRQMFRFVKSFLQNFLINLPIRDFAICGRGFRVWESRREFLKKAIAHRESSAIAFDQGRNAIATELAMTV